MVKNKRKFKKCGMLLCKFEENLDLNAKFKMPNVQYGPPTVYMDFIDIYQDYRLCMSSTKIEHTCIINMEWTCNSIVTSNMPDQITDRLFTEIHHSLYGTRCPFSYFKFVWIRVLLLLHDCWILVVLCFGSNAADELLILETWNSQ